MTPVPSGDSAKTDGFDLFEAWKEYEKIAMHFNDLLIKLRTQSLAAVAAFATVAGVLLKGDAIGEKLRWGTLAAVFTVLCLLWIAIWILDFTYYNRLLLGAVQSLVKLEKASQLGTRTDSLFLSADIEAVVAKGDGWSWNSLNKAKGRWAFYIIVFLLLAAGASISVDRLGGLREAVGIIRGQDPVVAINKDRAGTNGQTIRLQTNQTSSQTSSNSNLPHNPFPQVP